VGGKNVEQGSAEESNGIGLGKRRGAYGFPSENNRKDLRKERYRSRGGGRAGWREGQYRESKSEYLIVIRLLGWIKIGIPRCKARRPPGLGQEERKRETLEARRSETETGRSSHQCGEGKIRELIQ